VMFGCASPSHMIKILRAFHGARASGDDDVMRGRQCDDVSGEPHCSYCPGDCVDDSINEVSASAAYCSIYTACEMFTDRVSETCYAIGPVRPSVCPSVRLFPLCLLNPLAFELEILYVCGS